VNSTLLAAVGGYEPFKGLAGGNLTMLVEHIRDECRWPAESENECSCWEVRFPAYRCMH
jgi:hypothetical protein